MVLAPPRVIADDLQHYINQGGMELVTFTAQRLVERSRRESGQVHLPQFPAAGPRPDQRFSMFAYPVGPAARHRRRWSTRATWRARKPPAHFWFKLFPKKFRVRDFALDDALMEKLVNSVDPTGQLAPGPDLLSRFLKINGEMRRKNNQQLADLRFKTEEKILWNGPFIH